MTSENHPSPTALRRVTTRALEASAACEPRGERFQTRPRREQWLTCSKHLGPAGSRTNSIHE